MKHVDQLDKIEDIRRVAEGLQSLQHMLEIIDTPQIKLAWNSWLA